MTPPPSVHGGSSSEEPAETGRSGGQAHSSLGLSTPVMAMAAKTGLSEEAMVATTTQKMPNTCASRRCSVD